MIIARRFNVAGFALAGATLVTALWGCASSAQYAPVASNAAVTSSSVARAAVQSWSRGMLAVPLPSAGCFRSSYPDAGWTRVPCVAAPRPWFLPRTAHAVNPAAIGNGNDYGINVLPLTMTGAIGSFPSVRGAKTITSCAPKSAKGNSCGGHGFGPNVYSIQLNSNTFSTQACGKQRQHCLGWEQFVYTNQPKYYNGGGNLIIQDWLLSTSSQKLVCPPNAGWNASGGDCYKNAPYSAAVPNLSIVDLATVNVAGSADSTGDSAFLTVGTYVYGMKNGQKDGVTDLSEHWTGAEFNVFGNGGGTRAVFNAGTKITVALEALTGRSTKPACLSNAGTTGEENNLSFVAPPANPQKRQYPSIVFTESNETGGGAAACDSVAGL